MGIMQRSILVVDDDPHIRDLLTFALCRAATRRDMLEARWREESAGSVSEESHESA